MKKSIVLILILFSGLITLAQDMILNNNSIKTGFVFIDGKFIEPPYMVEYNEQTIFINKVETTKILKPIDDINKIVDHDPGIPAEITRNSSLDDLFKLKVKGTDNNYFQEYGYYCYSHFSFNEAKEMQINYVRSMPNIKNLIIEQGAWIYESYTGEKREFSVFYDDWFAFNHRWGPNGIGYITNEEKFKKEKERMERSTNSIREDLISNKLFIITNSPKQVRLIQGSVALKAIASIIEISDSNCSVDEKIKLLIENKIFEKTDTNIAITFLKNLQISDNYKLKIKNENK